MNKTREAVYAALFARFAGLVDAGGTKTFIVAERKLRDWETVQAEECPYLGQTQGGQSTIQRRGLPTQWKLGARLYIYVKTNASMLPSETPASTLNPILDAVDGALAPDATDSKGDAVCTLGGLVSHCWIEGEIETSEGLLGDTEVAIVPIEILVP